MLLHIGDTATAATFDPWLAVAGVLALLAATLWIWRRSKLVRRAARAAARGSVALVVAAAVLPSILPFDHLGLPRLSEVGGETAHAAHCHLAPGSCSDAPVPAGLGQFLNSESPVVIPALTVIAILLLIPLLTGITTRPEIRPPLVAS
jgi:hypothetical protein